MGTRGNGEWIERDTLDDPSPCVTASEHKAGDVGARGGTASPRRAVERIAAALNRPSPAISATGHDSGRDAARPSRRPIAELRAALLERPGPTIKENSYREGTSARPSQRPCGELALALAGVLDLPAHVVTNGGTETGGAEPFANARYRDALSDALAEAGLLARPSTVVAGRASVARAGHHIRHQDGAVRLGPAELAALQGFPADFRFHGNKTSVYRQIGNAFPPQPAEALGRALARVLAG